MDQKHAMLYPDTSGIPRDQRSSAAASIGLPVEAPPPSYDMAIQPAIGWSRPTTTSSIISEQLQYPDPQTNPAARTSIQNYGTHSTSHQLQYETAGTTATNTTITVQPTFRPSLGPNPSNVTCPACGAAKVSRVTYTPNTRTHLCAFVLCLVGWCCCACIVPYCMNSCRTGNHYCSKCNAFWVPIIPN